jgi:hypothetical protein
VRLVGEIGKPIAQVAPDLGINAGTLGNQVNADTQRRDHDAGVLIEDESIAELAARSLPRHDQSRRVPDDRMRPPGPAGPVAPRPAGTRVALELPAGFCGGGCRRGLA